MDILIPDIAIIKKVVRSQVVYVFLLVAFRVAGKRQPDQLTAFDLVVLLIISTVLHHKRLQRMVENVPTVLGRHGHVLHGNLDREHWSMASCGRPFARRASPP